MNENQHGILMNTLTIRYVELENMLKKMCPPCDIRIDAGDEHYLGFVKLKGQWRICSAMKKGELGDWRPIIEASTTTRLACAEFVELLWEEIDNAQNARIPLIKKAIDCIDKLIAKHNRDYP